MYDHCGIRYSGNSRMKFDPPLSGPSLFRNKRAATKAVKVPTTYIANNTKACFHEPSASPINKGTIRKYTGKRAEQLIHGATKIVTNRSFAESIVRVAITPGIAQA